MENIQQPNYLRRDLTTLAVIVLVMILAVGGLWYAEQQSGWFSWLAARALDAAGR